MKFFITGATGFIGQHLCHLLTGQGHEVVALVRNPDKAALLPKENIEILKGDLSSFKDPGFKIPACDQVIHLAGIVTAKRQSDYEKIDFATVVDLYSCLKHQRWSPTRLLFCSSQAAAGPSTERALTETDEPQPIDAYGLSKLNAEKFLLAQRDIPITIFRPCSVIGPMDPNILNLYKFAKMGIGLVPRGINQKISFIAVADLVHAISLLTQDKTDQHRVYFVSRNETTDTHGMWHEVARSLDKKIKLIQVPTPLLYLFMQANTLVSNIFGVSNIFDEKYYEQLKAKSWVCSSQKLQTDFNWTPQISISQAFAETAQGYKDAGWI